MRLVIDTTTDSKEDALALIDALFRTDEKGPEQNEETVVIQVRDGTTQTKAVKERLKQLSFKFYNQFKGREDPHWTLKCIPSYWESIKDDQVFDGLNVWTSNGGAGIGDRSTRS